MQRICKTITLSDKDVDKINSIILKNKSVLQNLTMYQVIKLLIYSADNDTTLSLDDSLKFQMNYYSKEDREEISGRLLNLRISHGFLKKDLADMIGVSSQTISNWESGTIPKANHLKHLSNIFNVSVSYIITGKDE